MAMESMDIMSVSLLSPNYPKFYVVFYKDCHLTKQ